MRLPLNGEVLCHNGGKGRAIFSFCIIEKNGRKLILYSLGGHSNNCCADKLYAPRDNMLTLALPHEIKSITFTVESTMERLSKYLHMYPKLNRITHNNGKYGGPSH